MANEQKKNGKDKWKKDGEKQTNKAGRIPNQEKEPGKGGYGRMTDRERLQKEIEAIKRKNGIPTVILVDGRRYILEHKDQYKTRKGRGQ